MLHNTLKILPLLWISLGSDLQTPARHCPTAFLPGSRTLATDGSSVFVWGRSCSISPNLQSCICWIEIPGSRANSFRELGGGYAEDDQSTYYCGRLGAVRVLLDRTHRQSFRVLGDQYAVTDFSAWFRGLEFPVKDVATIRYLGGFVVADRIHVYNRGVPIQLADPLTFEVLCEGQFGKDDRTVFHLRKRDERTFTTGADELKGADAKTFHCLPGSSFAADKNRVYNASTYNGSGEVVIPGANPSTFEVIEESEYARDATHVFLRGVRVEKARPRYFKLLRHPMVPRTYIVYTRDDRTLYYLGREVEGADPGSFEFLDHEFAVDKSHVIYRGKTMIDVDRSTFRICKGSKLITRNFSAAGEDAKYWYASTGTGLIRLEKTSVEDMKIQPPVTQ